MVRSDNLFAAIRAWILLFCIVLPFPLAVLLTKVSVHSGSGQASTLFTLETACFTVALIIITFLELKLRRSVKTFSEALPAVLILIGSLTVLLVWNSYACHVSYDYSAYENHARIYTDPLFVDPGAHGNLYPPTMSQTLASCFAGMKTLLAIAHMSPDVKFVWNGVFYLYQSVQLILMLGAYWLSYKFLQSLKMQNTRAAVLAAGVLLVDYPMISNLLNNQTNLWVLDALLLALIYSSTKPWIAGIGIAVGAHVKLYPAILLLPLGSLRCFKVIFCTFVATAAIVLIQTKMGTDWNVWRNYLTSLLQFNSSMTINSEVLNSNSLYAIASSFSHVTGLTVRDAFLSNFSKALSIVVIVLFSIRILVRSLKFRRFKHEHSDPTQVAWWLRLVTYASCIDSMTMALVISPRVFEHQYLALIPLILLIVATKSKEKPFITALGSLLLLIPFPAILYTIPMFKYHYVLGILVLVAMNKVSLPLPAAGKTFVISNAVPPNVASLAGANAASSS